MQRIFDSARTGAVLLAAALTFSSSGALAQTAGALAPAGVVPPTLEVTVTGAPADAAFLDQVIRRALDRAIRPTLRPNSSIRYGPIVPWPLPTLAEGSRIAVNVTVTIASDNSSTWVTGVTGVTVDNVATPAQPSSVLYLSDDPEHVQNEGVVFRNQVETKRPARLYYYHDDLGLPRDLDVVLTATAPSRVQIIESHAGPDRDVTSVGHNVSRDFLLYQKQNEGTIVDVVPGVPFVLQHDMFLQGETIAGTVDLHVLNGGPVTISVVATPAGGKVDAYIDGPRLPFDGHNRHGTFQLDGYGDISGTFTIGGPDAAVKYGSKFLTPRNVDSADPGHDYGDYGIVHRITFWLNNPTDFSREVYLYEKPLGGAVRSSFIVDGQLKEVGCARLAQPYWFMTYQLPPHSSGASTTLTMTDGGSYYPLEFGVTSAMPVPVTPPRGAVDGCSPLVSPSAPTTASTSLPSPVVRATQTPVAASVTAAPSAAPAPPSASAAPSIPAPTATPTDTLSDATPEPVP